MTIGATLPLLFSVRSRLYIWGNPKLNNFLCPISQLKLQDQNSHVHNSMVVRVSLIRPKYHHQVSRRVAEEVRALFVCFLAHPLCQRKGTHGACWEQTAVGGKTDEPRIRIRRVARWHRLQESGCLVHIQGKYALRGTCLELFCSPKITRRHRDVSRKNKQTNAADKLRFQREIRLEMNTNDAKEYLARREIPQLFEVRDGVRCVGMTWTRFVQIW